MRVPGVAGWYNTSQPSNLPCPVILPRRSSMSRRRGENSFCLVFCISAGSKISSSQLNSEHAVARVPQLMSDPFVISEQYYFFFVCKYSALNSTKLELLRGL